MDKKIYQDTIVRLYTDGACSGNQSRTNVGGWGAVLYFAGHEKELFGGQANTTNNRMELTAVIRAFQALNRPGLQVQVFSDGSYVMNCFRNRWYVSWERNGWKNAKKDPVENQDLWQELLALVRQHEVSFFRVKGHVSIGKSSEPALRKLYTKFVAWNGAGFSYEDFLFVTEMNNRADALANRGIDQIREETR